MLTALSTKKKIVFVIDKRDVIAYYDTYNSTREITMYYHNATNDFEININVVDGMFHIIMTLAGEKIECDGIKFIIDEDDFNTFTYNDWKNYFAFHCDEWKM